MATLDHVDIERTIARIKVADIEIKAWRAFSSINALKCPPIGAYSNQTQAPQPLKNVTVGVKDIIDVAGLPTRMGSCIYDGALAAAKDASCVARLRAAGAVIIGKTVTTEFASFIPSQTRNPLNLAHTPGGSSAGAAAAVAAGHVDIAIGTQTAGSILRPAAYCGVVGFKPSVGLIPTDGVLIQSPTLDTIGVFALSIDNCAAWLMAMTGQFITLDDSAESPKPLNLGFVNNWDQYASASMRNALKNCAKRLTDAGHQVQEITVPASLANLVNAQKIIQDVETARAYGAIKSNHGDKLTKAFAEALDQGAAIDEPTYQQALEDRANAIRMSAKMLIAVDAWLLPAASGEAPLGFNTTGDPLFNRFASGLGLPALSLPISHNKDQLPLGLQLIGGRRLDASLLNVARQINPLLR